MVVLRPFLRRAFRRLIRDFRHVAIVAGELDVIERHHLRRGHFVHFFNFGAVRQRDSVTSAFRRLGLEETTYAGAGANRRGGGDARDFDVFRRFAAFGQRRAAGFRISRDSVRALQNAFLRIFFVDIGGNALVAALVGVHLADDEERIGAFRFRRFGDGVVHFRLTAIEALDGDGVVRHQLNGLIFRQLHHAIDDAIFRRIRFRRVVFIEVSRDAPVAAIAVIRRVDNIE